jgi:hypothetical protein
MSTNTTTTDGHAAQSDLYGTRTAFSDPQYTVRAFTTTSPLAGSYDVIKGVTVTYSRREGARAIHRARARGLFIDVTFTYSKGGNWSQVEWDLS